LVAATSRGLRAILIGDDEESLRRDLQARLPRSRLVAADDELAAALREVVARVESPTTANDEPPMDAAGTPFQRAVWSALRLVPPGSTTTYSRLAAGIGRPAAVRAVASACAANPLAVVVPCHRVVRSDGSLSGYRWGVERKRWLLLREGARVLT
jgi:AraC family transcriptional regulator of adaptative response/methylated-DNA-[protein]-cysteine methyltransferase